MPFARALAGRLDRSRSLLRSALACAAMAGASTRAAGAAEGSPDGGTEIVAAPVEIVGTRTTGSDRAPAAQRTEVEAAAFGGEVRSVAELLASSPGAVLHSTGGPGQATTVSLRGASADQSLVLLDGIPLAGPGGGAIDLSTLPVGLIDRMIVSRGVLGAQLGSGALGGVIELVPKAPSHEGLQGGTQASFGSFGTAQLTADLSGSAAEASAWTAAVQLDRTAGDFDYQRKLTPELMGAPYFDDTRSNSDSQRAAALLRWETRLAAGATLSALAQATGGVRGLPGPIGGFTPHARASDAGWVAGGKALGAIGAGVWSIRGWARGSWLELRGLRAFGGDCGATEPGCEPGFSRSLAGRAEGELRLPVGESQWLSAVVSGGAEGVSGSEVGVRRRALGSVALADEVRLWSGKLLIHPAARLDVVGDSLGLSPGLAAVVRPFAEASALAPLELRAGAGWSFRAPTLAELYLDQGSIEPNELLQPEHAWSADAGVAWRGEQATVSIGGFWSRYRQLILYEQYPPARIKPFNVGAARIAGLELRAAVKLPWACFAESSYAYLDAQNQADDQTTHEQKLVYRPPHQLFLRGAHRGERFEGYAEVDAASSMPRNSAGTASLPGHVLLNAGAGVRAIGTLWLDLEAKNLLDDRTHQDLFQYPLPGFSLALIARARL